MKLIDLDDYSHTFCGHDGEYEKWNIDPDAVIPTIEPERKKGKWEQIKEQAYFRKHYKRICCSECKRRSEGDIKWNFCPYCGADMREGEAE